MVTRPWEFHAIGEAGEWKRFYHRTGIGDIGADQDVITALDAHRWGLAWFEQTAGEAAFVRHDIMGNREHQSDFSVAFSQPHALDLVEIDGDGLQDIVVAKRMWTHGPRRDVELNAPPVVYWFQLVRPAAGQPGFLPHLVEDRSGAGVQVRALDVNADGKTDILTASKLGTFLFLQ